MHVLRTINTSNAHNTIQVFLKGVTFLPPLVVAYQPAMQLRAFTYDTQVHTQVHTQVESMCVKASQCYAA